MSGARTVSLIPPEVSFNKTDSRLFELDEDGNEVRELPRLSKRTTKHVSFPAEEEQRDSLLVPLPEEKGEQICLGSMEADAGSQRKSNEVMVDEKTVETPGGYKVTARKIVRRLSRRDSNRRTDDKFSKRELLLILCVTLCVILFVLVVIIAVAAVIIVIVLQQKSSEATIKQGKDMFESIQWG